MSKGNDMKKEEQRTKPDDTQEIVNEEKEQKESYEEAIRRNPLMRVLAWVCLLALAGLIVLVLVTGITGSRYFLPSLALLMVVPVLLYVVLWLGKVLRNHREKRS